MPPATVVVNMENHHESPEAMPLETFFNLCQAKAMWPEANAVPGPKGDDGDQGPQGIPGLQGNTGPAGTNGVNAISESYIGVSNSTGFCTYSFTKVYTQIPHINICLMPPIDDLTITRITNISNTEVTCKIEKRSKLTVLSVELLSFAVTPVANISVSFGIFSRD